ncbi:MAG: hypothetical protein WCO26_08655, partial [Deltaproteobacteria bacterium]
RQPNFNKTRCLTFYETIKDVISWLMILNFTPCKSVDMGGLNEICSVILFGAGFIPLFFIENHT